VPFGDNKSIYVREVPVLDPSLYYLSEAEAAFFKAATRINNDEELKTHILMAQERAYKVRFISVSLPPVLTTGNLGCTVSLYPWIWIPAVREILHR